MNPHPNIDYTGKTAPWRRFRVECLALGTSFNRGYFCEEPVVAVDFSLRDYFDGAASIRGVELPEMTLKHSKGEGTSNLVKAWRLFYSLRSRLLYAFKRFSWLGAVWILLVTLFVEPLSRSTLTLMRRSWSGLKEAWDAYGMLWRWLPQLVFKGVTR